MNKSIFIRENNGKLFNITVDGVPTVEDLDDMRKNINEQAEKIGLTVTETENYFQANNGQSVMKPKLHKHSQAEVTFRSNTYIVKRDKGNSYGDIPKACNFTENSFTIDIYGGGSIKYTVA